MAIVFKNGGGVTGNIQGEVSHRDPKASFARTSKKDYVKQLARIERRHARIRCIRERLYRAQPSSFPVVKQNDIASGNASLEDRYQVGQSQNNPVDIFEFLQNNTGDPAIQVHRHHFGGQGVCSLLA